MTTIIAIHTPDGHVLVAADSQVTVCGSIRQTMLRSKIQTRYSDAVAIRFATAGELRLSDLVRYFPMPLGLGKASDDHEWLATEMIPALRAYCTEEGFPEEEDKSSASFEIMIVIGARVWRVGRDWSLFEPGGPHVAIGSGECYALGALHALSDRNPNMDPATLACAVLDAVTAYDVSTSPPYTLEVSEAER